MENLNIFKNEELGWELNIIDQNGEPWFIAKNVCDALSIGNSRQAVSYLDEDEKQTVTSNDGLNLSRNTRVLIINESGLYSLMLRSRKPEAKKFKRWVTGEILPSIRKHGMYVTEELLANPREAAKVFEKLAEEREARIEAERQMVVAEQKAQIIEAELEEEKPNIILGKAVSAKAGSIGLGTMAKILTKNGYKIGRNGLFEVLKKGGHLIYTDGHYEPSQYSSKLGIFDITYKTFEKWGKEATSIRVLITAKGQKYFIQRGEKIMSILQSL